MVYIQPIIDYYLISLVFENTNKTNYLEKFQREILRSVAGVGRYVAGTDLEKHLAVSSIAVRLSEACSRFEDYLVTPTSDQVSATKNSKKSRNIATRIRQIAAMKQETRKGRKIRRRVPRFNEKFVTKWTAEARMRFKSFKATKRI